MKSINPSLSSAGFQMSGSAGSGYKAGQGSIYDKGFFLGLSILILALALSSRALGAQPEDRVFQAFKGGEGQPLIIESDRVSYDDRTKLVKLLGAIKINQGQTTLLGDVITLDIANKKLLSPSPVVLIDQGGWRYQASSLAIDFALSEADFHELVVRTKEQAYFTAESASFKDGRRELKTSTFTTCKPCAEDPDKPRTWRIEAERITDDTKSGYLTMEKVKLRFFGVPVAYIPYARITSPSVERKSGFLMPRLNYNGDLGFIASSRYHFALAPDYDLTVEGGLASKGLGFMSANWRQLTSRGRYNVRPILAYTNDKARFSDLTRHSFLMGVETEGRLDLGSDWQLSWEALYSNAPKLIRSLGLVENTKRELESRVSLTRYQSESLADVSMMVFQPIDFESDINRQAKLLPHASYRHYHAFDGLSGEIDTRADLSSFYRSENEIKDVTGLCDKSAPDKNNCLLIGAKGKKDSLNLSTQWRDRTIYANGLEETRFLYGGLYSEKAMIDEDTASRFSLETNNKARSSFRGMAGLEYRLPLLVEGSSTTQIIEPLVQVVASTRQGDVRSLTNETSQSLVLDSTSLLSWNRFASSERWETGLRMTYGVDYSAVMSDTMTLNAFIGQSVHLAGKNSFQFDGNDLNAQSGLEDRFSDVIMGLDLEVKDKLSLDTRVQFSPSNLDLRRFELGMEAVNSDLSGSLRFVHIAARPQAGYNRNEQQITFSSGYKISDYWSLYAKANYDVLNKTLISRGFGLGYEDDCFALKVSYDSSFLDGVEEKLTESLMFEIELKPFEALSATIN